MKHYYFAIVHVRPTYEALPGVWGTGEKGIYFRGTGEQRSNCEGNRGTKTILGNREHKKTNFRFWGNRGTSQFISGEQGNRYPPLGGPHLLSDFNYCRFKDAFIIIMTIGLYYFSLEQVNVLLQLEARISSDKASNLPKRDVRFILLK